MKDDGFSDYKNKSLFLVWPLCRVLPNFRECIYNKYLIKIWFMPPTHSRFLKKKKSKFCKGKGQYCNDIPTDWVCKMNIIPQGTFNSAPTFRGMWNSLTFSWLENTVPVTNPGSTEETNQTSSLKRKKK